MERIGDELAGFSVDSAPSQGVRVKGWGFWSVEVATAFAGAVLDAVRNQPRGAPLTLDLADLKPMRDEGQQALSRVLRAAPSLGTGSTSIVTTNPLTRLQLVRLASESGADVRWLSGTTAVARDA
jgi:hypothetical protein